MMPEGKKGGFLRLRKGRKHSRAISHITGACAGARTINPIILPILPILPCSIKYWGFIMAYHDQFSGRVGDEASDAGRITFEGVVERLIEAWGFMWRMPDREAGWLRAPRANAIYQRGQLSRQELWALYQVDSDDYDRDALPKLPGLRTAEVDRMDEALGWVEWVDPAHRRLVGMVLQSMHRGDEAQVPWTRIAKRLGWAGHPDTLSKRWSRAIFRIAQRLEKATNGGNPHLGAVNPSNALGVK